MTRNLTPTLIRRWLLPALAICAMPAAAHHSYAMFDMTKTIALDATITQFKWQNPHSFIEADIKVPDGNEHLPGTELGSRTASERGQTELQGVPNAK